MTHHQPDLVRYRGSYRWLFGLGFWVLGAVLGVAVAVAVANGSRAEASLQDAQNAQHRADQSAAQQRSTGEQIAKANVCVSTDPTDVAQFGVLCDIARKVASQPQPSPVDTQALANAVTALVVASLPARVESAVQRYMAAHPTASRDEIREWVKQEVAAAPAQPGKDGAAGKDGLPGERGLPGTTGPGPTDAQVDAAVARWFAAHPPNVCQGTWESHLDSDGVFIYRCRQQ